MLNVDFLKEFTTFAAILAGFSLTVTFRVMLHPLPPSKCQIRAQNILTIAFLIASVLMILAVLLSALLISVQARLSNGQPATPEMLNSAILSFFLIAFGSLVILVGIGASGFIISKGFGIFTIIISSLSAISGITICCIVL